METIEDLKKEKAAPLVIANHKRFIVCVKRRGKRWNTQKI
jgi:hypothetical protein